MTVAESPSEKAWAYLRQVMDDDEKFFTLKVKSEPVDVIGSEGGRYILYPNGRVVIVGKTEAKLGKAINENRIAHPDILSTLWVWITQKESEFLKNWQCGNLSVFYERGEGTNERIDRLGYRPDLVEDANAEFRLRMARRRHHEIMAFNHHWYDDIGPSNRTMRKLVLMTTTIALIFLLQHEGYIDITPMIFLLTNTTPNSTVTQPVEVTQLQEPQEQPEAYHLLILTIIFLCVFLTMLLLKKTL